MRTGSVEDVLALVKPLQRENAGANELVASMETARPVSVVLLSGVAGELSMVLRQRAETAMTRGDAIVGLEAAARRMQQVEPSRSVPSYGVDYEDRSYRVYFDDESKEVLGIVRVMKRSAVDDRNS
jgi:hypothetical protein